MGWGQAGRSQPPRSGVRAERASRGGARRVSAAARAPARGRAAGSRGRTAPSHPPLEGGGCPPGPAGNASFLQPRPLKVKKRLYLG